MKTLEGSTLGGHGEEISASEDSQRACPPGFYKSSSGCDSRTAQSVPGWQQEGVSHSWSRVLPSEKEVAGHRQECPSEGSFMLEENLNFPLRS